MPAGAASGLVARDLRLARGDRSVLAGASIDVPPGQVTALIAPSGAGKSTLLRCLNRLLDPDQGTITLGGVDIRTIPPRALRHRIGLVAQRPVMLEGTVAANLRYALSPVPGDEQVERTLAAAGLTADFAARDARELSGGEQARVAIARAIIREPEILLFDEPTAALDEDSAAQLGDTFRQLATDGLGLCLAIHDRPFAERYADRIVHLDGTTEVAQ